MAVSLRQLFSHTHAQTKHSVPAELVLSRYLFVASVAFLLAIGITMVFSASSIETINLGESIFSYVRKQLIFITMGLVMAAGLSFVPYEFYGKENAIRALIAFIWVLLIAVMILGQSILGASRWIIVGPISIQPSEFIKIMIVVVAAWALAMRNTAALDGQQFWKYMAIGVVAPILTILITQSDMGTTAIIFLGVFAVFALSGFNKKALVLIAIGMLALLILAIALAGYRSGRIVAWIDPWSDPQGVGYQVIHSMYAIASGGLQGLGLGNSHEKYLYLPEAENDFIFAIIGEELGFIGAFGVLLLFFILLIAGMRIAAAAPDDFGSLVAAGLTIMLVSQAFINIACALNLLPTTGKPLPFISAGGSSMISSLSIIGIVFSISRASYATNDADRRRSHIRARHASEIKGSAPLNARARRERGALMLVDMRSSRTSGNSDKNSSPSRSQHGRTSRTTRTQKATASKSRTGRTKGHR